MFLFVLMIFFPHCNLSQQGWIGFTLLSEMPSYLTDVLGFDLGSAGILSMFPYLALFISTLLFARGFDYLQREYGWEVNSVRVTAMFIAYMGSALGLIVCGFLDAKYAAYCFMILTQVCSVLFRLLSDSSFMSIFLSDRCTSFNC